MKSSFHLGDVVLKNGLIVSGQSKDLDIENKLIEWTVKTFDAFFIHSVRPAIGSIVYCNLAIVAEHTGIYVGRNKIVHLNGNGRIEKVSAEKFCDRLGGNNPAFTIFCPTNSKGKAVGDKLVAEYALRCVGRLVNYNVALNNCHCFTASCLVGRAKVCPSFSDLEMLITEKYGACDWRATVLNRD